MEQKTNKTFRWHLEDKIYRNENLTKSDWDILQTFIFKLKHNLWMIATSLDDKRRRKGQNMPKIAKWRRVSVENHIM